MGGHSHSHFLYLDNAVSHDINKVLGRRVHFLEKEYNFICIHQHLRSPVTDILNLGVWMVLHNVIERLAFGNRNEKE